MGNGYSIGWRLLDAQYWGVPQRRKRIYLVADLDGRGGATEILFKSEGLSRYSAQSFRAWQRLARDIEDGSPEQGEGIDCFAIENHPHDCRVKVSDDGIVQTLTSRMGTGGNNVPIVMNKPVICLGKGDFMVKPNYDQCEALLATDYKDPKVVSIPNGQDYTIRRLTPTECARLQGFPDWWTSDLSDLNPSDEEIAFWRDTFDTYTSINGQKPKTDSQIRRFLKNPNSDSAEYKMWGNGIALPCAWFVMAGIAWYDSKMNDNK